MRSFVRTTLWTIGVALLGGVALWIMDLILDDFSVGGFWSLLLAAVTISGGMALLFPYLFRFSARIHPLLFPVLIFALAGGLVSVAAKIDDWIGRGDIYIANIETAIWIALGMTILDTMLGTLFSFDDERSYHRLVTDGLKAQAGDVPRSDEPGFMFIETDGLSADVLEKAMVEGYMPTLKRWRDSGEYKVTVWEPDLSSQTSASQAGLLLGDNTGIPAFRWWDKPEQKLLVSSKPSTAELLEAKLANGTGLLEPDGASRFNVFTGGAIDNVGVFSKLSLTTGGSNRYFAYMFNPYMLGRVLSFSIQDIFREWWEEFRQKRNHVEPFLPRPWTYAFTRTGCTAAMFEASRFLITADIVAGVPSAYHLVLGYDEMAHHTGPSDPYSLKFLKRFDHMIATLEDVVADAPRPFHIILLSDHGQSQGKTFLQRYGVSFGQVTEDLLEGRASMTSILDSNEAADHMSATFQEATDADSMTAKVVRTVVPGSAATEQDEAALDEDKEVGKGELAGGRGYVLASGNLGLISFTQWPERMTLEQIHEAFPALITGLVNHPGIGFVMVRSEKRGPLAIGPEGIYVLNDDTVEGKNPIAIYGELAPYHLRRHDSFDNCPDILVLSTYWPETGEVAALEELIGSHGGLGGWQRHPYIMHPVSLDAGEELIIGPGALNAVMRGWIDAVQPGRNATMQKRRAELAHTGASQ